MCSRHDGQRWRRLINAFDGGEAEPGEVPTWVGDVVLRGANVTPKEAKCAFVLLPMEVRGVGVWGGGVRGFHLLLFRK